MATIQDVIALVEQHPDLADPFGTMSEEAIRRAEAELGFDFPPSYRTFVSIYGSLAFASQEFHGLTGERADGIPNVVWRTLRAREGGLPTHMILVLEPGIGDTVFCIDTSRVDAEGKSPVIEWIDGAKASEQDLEPYAADFSDFAVKMMNLGLEIEAEQDEEED